MRVKFGKADDPDGVPPFHYDRPVLARAAPGGGWVTAGTMRTYCAVVEHPARPTIARNWKIEITLDGVSSIYSRTIFDPPPDWPHATAGYWDHFRNIKRAGERWASRALAAVGGRPTPQQALIAEYRALLDVHAELVDRLRANIEARRNLETRIEFSRNLSVWRAHLDVLEVVDVAQD